MPTFQPLSGFTPTVLRTILQQFCETSFHSIVITTADPGYPIVYANPQFCEMTGYTLEELLGRSPKILQGNKTNPKVLQRLKSTITAGQVFHGAAINYRKSGEPYPVEWNISTIRNENNDISYYLSIQKDLSHLKEVLSLLKRNNENFRKFLLDISYHRQQESSIDTNNQKQLTEELLRNARLYNPNLRTPENIDLFSETEFFDCDHGLNGILASEMPYEKISARAYNDKYNVTLDVQELSHRIVETQQKIDLLRYSSNIGREFTEIAQNLQDIANDIFFLEEFVEVSSTLSELARRTRLCTLEVINPMVVETYRGLMTDLEAWLDTMFIQQNEEDVHSLDASIISSAKQLLHFLK